jgi:hypothetical protein
MQLSNFSGLVFFQGSAITSEGHQHRMSVPTISEDGTGLRKQSGPILVNNLTTLVSENTAKY